jgi:broad specificity phosphatase PhoE
MYSLNWVTARSSFRRVTKFSKGKVDASVTRIFIIRHGEADGVGLRLLGRTPGIHLTAKGRTQAWLLGRYLRGCDVAAIFTSPIERAAETASVIAEELGLVSISLPGITELEFGGWSGKSFEELSTLEEWMRFNCARADTCPPEGEDMRHVQIRAIAAISQLAIAYPGKIIAVVTHADVIRAVLAAWLPASLDEVWRIEIGIASVSAVELEGPWPKVLLVNGLSGERELGLLSCLEERASAFAQRKFC